jgi:hypothetical protein
MILGLAFALGSALSTNLGFLFKQRGAVVAPAIRLRNPLRGAAGLFRSRWFLVGWAVSVLAWGLHVGALSLAPLSTVQAVLSGGLVFRPSWPSASSDSVSGDGSGPGSRSPSRAWR